MKISNGIYIDCSWTVIFQSKWLVYLEHKDSKKHFKLIIANIKNFSECNCRQLKYHQHRIRSETGVLREIIVSTFKCLTVSSSTEILTLVIASLSFIYSKHPLWICYAAKCAHFTVPSEKRGAFFFLSGQMYSSGSTFIKKIESLLCRYISMLS